MWGVGKRSTVLQPGPSPSVSPGPWAVNSLLPTGGRTGRREWAGVGCPLSPGQSGPQRVGAWGPRFSRGQTSLGRTEFSGVFQKKKKRFALTVKLTQMWASRGVLDAQTCPCVPSSARSVTAEVFLAGHRLLWRFQRVTACSGEQRLPASPLCLSQPRARVAVCPASLPLLQTREENRCFFSPLGRRVDFQASYLQKRRL